MAGRRVTVTYYIKPVVVRLKVAVSKTRLTLRVQANASSSAVIGWHGGALRVRVAAPPAGGRANHAVVNTLARALDVRPSSVSIVRGFRSRDKVIEVIGLVDAEVRDRLEASLGIESGRAVAR